MPNNNQVFDVKPLNKQVKDTRSNNQQVEDFRPNNSDFAYPLNKMFTATIQVGQPMGLLLALTYPASSTFDTPYGG
jgi:hypothetical protein